MADRPPFLVPSTKEHLRLGAMPDEVLKRVARVLATSHSRAGGRVTGPYPDLVAFASLSRAARHASLSFLKTAEYKNSVTWASFAVDGAARQPANGALARLRQGRHGFKGLSVVNLGPKSSRLFAPPTLWAAAEQDGRALLQLLETAGIRGKLRRLSLEKSSMQRNIAVALGQALSTMPRLKSLRLVDVSHYLDTPVQPSPKPVVQAVASLYTLEVLESPGFHQSAHEMLLSLNLDPDLFTSLTYLALSTSLFDDADDKAIKSLKKLVVYLECLALLGPLKSVQRPVVNEVLEHIVNVPTHIPHRLSSLFLHLDDQNRPNIRMALAVLGRSLRCLVLIGFGSVRPDDLVAIANAAPQLKFLMILAGDGSGSVPWDDQSKAYLGPLKSLKRLRVLVWDKTPDVVAERAAVASSASRKKKDRRRDNQASTSAAKMTPQVMAFNTIRRALPALKFAFCVESKEGELGTRWRGYEGVFNPTTAYGGHMKQGIFKDAVLDLDRSFFRGWRGEEEAR